MAEKSIAKTASREEELKKVSRAMLMRQLLPAVGLVAVFIVFNILTKGRMVSKFSLVMSQVYVTMIASTGVFFIMTMGGLDFSQGSILGMASIVVCMVSKVSIPLSILAGIGTGAAIGAMNGFFYVNRKIKSFIVTICTMFLFRGIIKYMTSNSPVMGDIKLTMLGMNETLKMVCTLVVIVLGLLAFRFTKFGIHLKAIGAGEKAAKYAGIRTDRMKFLVYVLAGAITGFAAFINAIKVGSVTASGGNQLETQILIALVLGGMPISGGAKSSFLNVIIGSLLYTVLISGLNMMGLTTQAMQLVQGVVFLIFVTVFADRQSLQVIK
ncbi:ABC transporter permease [Porcincola intestinalis]|jgi:ribose transport system permease protein|uniref:ABC transporter permease n=1 Tax=Porcincola intestinalis TaxID=2606632 RepID=UPI0023F09954|nr:ABC transporter permease [Porcincola intestinalis]MCI6697623.1 ABC transporter permease [Lachnospiraceae bacterium]MCI6766409.1 ABC transporter permease [Lachnospiraceae bacterium]MDD7059527.1 ABC transporter permease [Porcincola intestinalis]MDY4204575.1 ABC transporter permease [Porcincola intestinalis]MDY5283775.1 ABC transporter permease [Porcincola intestinalis]